MYKTILEKIADAKMKRLETRVIDMPINILWKLLEQENPQSRPWLLNSNSFNVIAEVKRASPSLGKVNWHFSLPDLVRQYKAGGAAAISVLTEEDFFLGSFDDLRSVRETVELPILRKDFLLTEYDVLESKVLGADCILLITALLDQATLFKLLNLAKQLELETIVECHNKQEIESALVCGAKTIGINNRDLKTFEVRLETTSELIKLIPSDCVVISESGIHTIEDVKTVAKEGANAILVGESCIRQTNPAGHIADLVAQGRSVRGV